MNHETTNTNQEQGSSSNSWDTLAQDVPFQPDTPDVNQDASTENTAEQKPLKTVGEWYRSMLSEIDLTTDEMTERFREGKIYEDQDKYSAEKITNVDYIDDFHGDGKIRTMTVSGWPDGLTYVQPYKRDESRQYPKGIAEIIAPSSDHQCAVVKTTPLYRLVGQIEKSSQTVSPTYLDQHYTKNEDGTFHNTELLRIIKAKPEEQLSIDKEQLKEADQTAMEDAIYILPVTEYLTAPVDLQDPENIPLHGRRTEMSIPAGYGPIE